MAKVIPFEMDKKYGALRTLIIVLYVLAACLLLAALISIADINGSGVMAFAPFIACVIMAFNFVVVAQIITVFIDMEWNQRETNELLEQVIKNLPEPKAAD